jgi:4,5:9,10-diseco-3-hydroxy-5,9,17-trioxoandrosta-1(10),2-diene-4-oate hydrolase
MSIAALGYIEFEVSSLDKWEAFATRVLGVEFKRGEGSATLRWDERAARVFLREGPKDDLLTVGFECANDAELDATVASLRKAGVDVTEGTADECAGRSVDRMFVFREICGNRGEAYVGGASAGPYTTDLVPSGFVTGEQGLGHIVLRARDRDAAEDWYINVLGFGLSDHIITDIAGFKVDIAFLHTNPRHHSVALGENLPKRLHHMMLQVGTLDDLGRCYDRAKDNRVPITQSLGRHPNDEMVSYYALTPSGFEYEYGWGARTVTDDHEATTYDHISRWGHRRPRSMMPPTKPPRLPRGSDESPVPVGKFAQVGPHKLHYHELGEGTPLLFLHGSGPGASGYSNFKRNVSTFAAKGHRCLVLDILGYGHSDMPTDVKYTLDFLATTIVGFLDAIEVETCSIIGNSMGGALAALVALDYPDRVEKLVLMAPGGLEATERYMEMKGIRTMLKMFFKEGVNEDTMRKVFDLQLCEMKVDDVTLKERLAIATVQPKEVLKTLRVPYLTDRLEELKIPVLGFWGADDQFCPVSGATTLATKCADAQVVLLSRCGHWVMVEEQEVFDRTTLKFLRKGTEKK